MEFPEFTLPDGSILIPATCLDCYADLICLQYWLAYRLDGPVKQIDGKWACNDREKLKEGEQWKETASPAASASMARQKV